MVEATGLRYTTRVLDGGLGLSITMHYVPHMGSAEALAALLIEELKQRNVVFGLDEQAIRHMLQERTTGSEVTIAHGAPVRRGHDADIELLRVPPSFMATTAADGRADYRNIENVSQVKAGEVISRKTPADPGEPGYNIFGKEIRPPAVRDATHPRGRNTIISDDGLEMTAAIDGFLRWRGSAIEVVELYLLASDVDLRTGNIHYQGDIEIYGNVMAGFEVVAGGDVRVFGTVDGGHVVSEQGTATISGGVLGSSEGPGMVTALGDVQIGRGRFARLESRTGAVIANAAVEHSEIRAAGDLILRAGPAMSCVVDVGGKVDVSNVSAEPGPAEAMPAPAHSSASGNRRKYLRVPLAPPVAVQLIRTQPGQPAQGTALDLSAGGIRVRPSERLREGEHFRLQFKLPGVDGTMWMDADVVRTCTPLVDRPEPSPSYGIQFAQIEPAIRESIAKYCLAEDLRQHKLTGKAS